MAPADLGTDMGDGGAVPALPMHTDPVSIAVSPAAPPTTQMHADAQAVGLDHAGASTLSTTRRRGS